MNVRPATPILADTMTKLPAEATGKVVICGSHGGIYPGYLASKAGLRAIILNDAGVGKDAAGIGSLDYCQRLGMAAATVAHDSARIGDSADMLARGSISHANGLARQYGCKPGLSCAEAAQALTRAPLSDAPPTPYREGRYLIEAPGHSIRRSVICIDSASLVQAEDTGQIVITGSHGGLIGSDPMLALQVDASAAFFNDAGVGIDNAGITRLPALAERGIAAGCVAANSARIGDGRSSYYDGVLSALNEAARNLGGQPKMPLRDFVALLQAD